MTQPAAQPNWFHRLANPARFTAVADALLPWLVGLCILSFTVGLLLALMFSPPDYQQGESVRIMYVHVPAAWWGLGAYVLVAAGSFVFLVWRHAVAFLVARAAAVPGAVLTALCLITGSLWGKPMWGTWWAWDPRLTSMLILLFLYIGYLTLVEAFDDPRRGQMAASILALAGVVNVPIIKFSVDWWNSLHQPASITRIGAPAIDPSMLTPLLVMGVAYGALLGVLVLLGAKTALLEARARARATQGQAQDNRG